MKLTKVERAILVNQNLILAKLYPENSADYLFKSKIAENGYEGHYEELFNNLSEGISEEECRETSKILSMFRAINNTIASLTDEEKETLDLEKFEFKGFDANNDNHYFYMKFIVEEANLFREHKGSYMNSHTISTIRRYRKMLAKYNQIITANNYRLNFEGLKQIGEVVF